MDVAAVDHQAAEKKAAEERAAAAAAANGGVPHNETTAGITGPVGDYSKKRISCACVRPWLDKARRSVPVPILFSIHMALRLLATPMLLGANRLWAAAGVWFGLVVISGVFRPMRWVEDSFVVIGGDIECIIYVFFRLVEPCTATHHAVEVTTIGAVVCGTTARLIVVLWRFFFVAVRDYHIASVAKDDAAKKLQALKHEHQQARNNGHAARARELELRIQSLIEIWGLVEDEEEVEDRFLSPELKKRHGSRQVSNSLSWEANAADKTQQAWKGSSGGGEQEPTPKSMTPAEYDAWRASRPKIVEASVEEAEEAAGGAAFTTKDIKHRVVQQWYLSKVEAKVAADKKEAKAPTLKNKLNQMFNSSKFEGPGETQLKLKRLMAQRQAQKKNNATMFASDTVTADVDQGGLDRRIALKRLMEMRKKTQQNGQGGVAQSEAD
eukprot:INCI16276.4.p1 GENE.INCI16276.4~~INCI16276.4.p1  ORF type:complete len:439 (+),score=98.47 INCI16276.4:149-1465(+)